MSSISLRSFSAAAQRAPDGEIRIAKDTENELVNKGALGQRFATWFGDLGQAIPDPTRAQRQQAAIEGFRAALAGHYGADIAHEVLDGKDLGEDGAGLTGRVVSEVIGDAHAISRDNERTYIAEMNKLLPGAEGFSALVEKALGEDIAPEALSEQETEEYTIRFQARIGAEPLGKALSKKEVKKIAAKTLKQVHHLSETGKLEGAIAARKDFTAALKDTLRGLASGRGVTSLLRSLNHALIGFYRHAQAETGEAADPRKIKEFCRDALARAIGDLREEDRALGELRGEDRPLLLLAQENALERGAPLRAIHTTMGATQRGRDSHRASAMWSACFGTCRRHWWRVSASSRARRRFRSSVTWIR